MWRALGALAAGIGFGLFIDELGKFITSDNDYFFQPVIAIIYVIFVALFFLFRWLGSVKHLSPQVALVNAFDYAKEAVLRDMDESERVKALGLLSHADQTDPVVVSLGDMLRALDAPATAAHVTAREGQGAACEARMPLSSAAAGSGGWSWAGSCSSASSGCSARCCWRSIPRR